jgi:hypothetical protein
VLALGLLMAAVLAEIVAGPALRPGPSADALAIPGVAAMAQQAQVDPTEIAQVAARQHPPVPLALPAQALLDGLLLLSAAVLAVPRVVPRQDVARGTRLALFVGSLALLLVAVAVGVAAIARLRYLVALYLSPPFGTLSYFLLFGSSRRGASLVVLSVVLVVRVGACLAFLRAFPGRRPIAALAITSTAATVVTAVCYAWVPNSLASITDALAAAVVALLAAIWAAMVVSGSVRRLA